MTFPCHRNFPHLHAQLRFPFPHTFSVLSPTSPCWLTNTCPCRLSCPHTPQEPPTSTLHNPAPNPYPKPIAPSTTNHWLLPGVPKIAFTSMNMWENLTSGFLVSIVPRPLIPSTDWRLRFGTVISGLPCKVPPQAILNLPQHNPSKPQASTRKPLLPTTIVFTNTPNYLLAIHYT